MPTGAAGGNVDAGGVGEFFVGNLHLAQENLARVERDAAQRGVGNGPRLLPDFLEHEVLVAALFRLDRIPLHARQLALHGLAVKIRQRHAFKRQDRHIAVGKKINVARVMQNSRHIAGDKRLALAHADHHRRAQPRRHNLVRLRGAQHAQRKRARQPLHCAPHRVLKLDRLARRLRFVLHLLNQVGNDLGVGLGNKLVALRGQLPLQLEIVFDDAVVHHDDAPGAVAVRMCVLFRGPAVRCPARVSNAEGAVQWVFAQHFFQVRQLAWGAPHLELWVPGFADGDARRVVTSIFQAP